MVSRIVLRFCVNRQQIEYVTIIGFHQIVGSDSLAGAKLKVTRNRFFARFHSNLLYSETEILPRTAGVCDHQELKTTASVDSRKYHLSLAMQETFQITEAEAQATMQSSPVLWQFFLVKTFSFLKNVGLTKESFISYPWLSAIPHDNITQRLQAVKAIYPEWGDINICAPLLQFSVTEINKKLEQWKKEASGRQHKSKFHFMAEELEADIGCILKNACTKKFLMTIPFVTLDRNIKLLLESGVNKEQILADIWSLKNSPNFIRDRLNKLTVHGVPIKMWHFRCNTEILNRCVKQHCDTKDALGNAPDYVSFLCQQLDCSHEAVERMLKRQPRLSRCQPNRLKAVFDMLAHHGITQDQIFNCPGLLLTSSEKLEQRIILCKSINMPLIGLSVLIVDEKSFQKIISKWISSNK